MEKVYLALETVALTAEKTKLENDCREGASELKTTDVSVSHTFYIHLPCWGVLESSFCITVVCCPCALAAKMQPSGAEEGPADRTMQRPVEESEDYLQDAT